MMISFSFWILETIVFNAALQEYSEISDENSVKFDVVLLNEGDG